ncbi:alpha/beta hydrolase [Rhizobium sp. LjRoot98]|uniref:alpha/beta fold hydrolase n=1 Tax=Rhizobium sp. LjRoot98 TaxID=3342345 RepID=UPI003ECE5FC9
MHTLETGTFLGRVPFARIGGGLNPILVINGGQGFMMAPDRERMSKDVSRLKRLLPNDRSIVLIGYDPSPTTVTVEGLAHDAAEIIDRHLGGRADVMGISYGGVVAAHLAARWPEKIDRLILIASAHRFSTEGKLLVRRQIELVETGDMKGLLKEFTSMFRNPWLNWLVGLRVCIGGNRMLKRFGKPEAIVRYLDAMLRSELPGADALPFDSHTLIIGGSRDQFFAEAIIEAASRNCGVRVTILDGDTHMAPVERATAVNRSIASFLSQTSP